MFRIACISVALVSIIMQPALTYGRSYTVKSGDTLSGIVHREIGGPVWGSGGTLESVLSLNPNISNPNLIFPNQIIILQFEQEVLVHDHDDHDPAFADEPYSEPDLTDQYLDEVSAATSSRSRLGFRVLGILSGTEIEALSDDRSFETVLNSALNHGIAVSAYYYVSSQSKLGLKAQLLKSGFQATSDERFQGLSKNLKQFEIFWEMSLFERWILDLGLGSEQAYFLAQTGPTTFQIDPIFSDYARLSLGYDVFVIDETRLAIVANSQFHGPQSGRLTRADSGFVYGLESRAIHKLSASSSIIGALFYQRRVQDAARIRQRTNDMGMELGLQYDY